MVSEVNRVVTVEFSACTHHLLEVFLLEFDVTATHAHDLLSCAHTVNLMLLLEHLRRYLLILLLLGHHSIVNGHLLRFLHLHMRSNYYLQH